MFIKIIKVCMVVVWILFIIGIGMASKEFWNVNRAVAYCFIIAMVGSISGALVVVISNAKKKVL